MWVFIIREMKVLAVYRAKYEEESVTWYVLNSHRWSVSMVYMEMVSQYNVSGNCQSLWYIWKWSVIMVSQYG